ncbi:uncharacterized protein LOC135463181 [Liolophura sinensis]|uniref:uncharacterized protein LOC135463181 n=1 Tax=Liolophura sinensis TaxID=3198878 RepID=UPI003158BA6D
MYTSEVFLSVFILHVTATITLLTTTPVSAGTLPRSAIGECPRGYVMNALVGCEGLEGMTCSRDQDCPMISRCCFNGCQMTCLSLMTLVQTYCVEDGEKYHPGELFKSGCSMCACGKNGKKTGCKRMPNCGQPNMILLPDGPIESDDVIMAPLTANPWLELPGW